MNSMVYALKCCKSMSEEQTRNDLDFGSFLPYLHTGA